MQMMTDQQKLIYNSSVRSLNVVLKTCWKWWTIETNGERDSDKSVLAVWDDDIDDLVWIYYSKVSPIPI